MSKQTSAHSFTPGPWRLSTTYPARVCGEREGGTYVADCHSNGEDDDLQDWANARLVAAAPDMHELLSTFTEWARQVAAQESVPRGIRSAAAGLRQDGQRLLAKATGGQP